MHRRSLLLASGALAGSHFLGRPALAQQAQIKGVGTTFPQQAFAAWSEAAKKAIGIELTYDATDAADGIAKVAERSVDFGTTDAPVPLNRLREKGLLQFPSMLGPIVFVVNLPGVATNQLKLTGDCIADLYLGKLTKWNDARFKEHNPGLALPDLPVTPVYRSDASGTTMLTTTYLSRASEAWRNGPRAGRVVTWPAGKGAALDAGIADTVKATPGAIGFVKNAYAAPKQLTTVQIKNHSGNFVKPELASFYAASETTDWSQPGFIVDMIDHDGAKVWPIIGPSFTLVCTSPAADKVESLRNTLKFFDWAFNHGDEMVRLGGNASLPDALNKAVHQVWSAIKDPSGRPIWAA